MSNEITKILFDSVYYNTEVVHGQYRIVLQQQKRRM